MQVIVPDIFPRESVRVIFTTKAVAGDLAEISAITMFPPNHIYLPVQKHTDKVAVIDYDLQPLVADAVISRRKGLLIGVQVADCVPVLIYDTRNQAFAAVHAGWRGTAEGIVRKTIGQMVQHFSSSPPDMLVALGPSIRSCCYQVGYEVIDAVRRATGEGSYVIGRGATHYLDLAIANRLQALASGVLPRNIWTSDDCTSCLPEKYYSYRRDRAYSGKQFGFIGLV
jgi:purine-nucleoside/S-methyl-5'-thioadenosine phosphorylase / adenosine deaminase